MNNEYQQERRHYLTGFALAVITTIGSFYLALASEFSSTLKITGIVVLALIQIVVHFRYFLHIDFSRQKREDLHLILFTSLLIFIMVGGTLLIMGDLAQRMH
ncbi:cytochrome o ubiquinol oxidase subunit IV [Neptunicella sp. SCSIO 80796]|uniref:cytochrome o ubiquinol oxidase subunit IV n=1 Tax=Neptunicella plasticusilytica TaxID=3117012 RepID=UPI003A4E154C